MPTSTRRAALYVQGLDRRPRPDRREPATAAPRGCWAAWVDRGGHLRDEGISGSRGRDKRPGLDALLKGVARREFDIVAAWSVCRLGRSLSDLIGLLGELQARDIDLYLHQQAIDTSTHQAGAVRHVVGVLRVRAGDDPRPGDGRAGSREGIWQATGSSEDDAVQVGRIRVALDEGRGVRETARLLKVPPAKVCEVRRMSPPLALQELVVRGLRGPGHEEASVIAFTTGHSRQSLSTMRAAFPGCAAAPHHRTWVRVNMHAVHIDDA